MDSYSVQQLGHSRGSYSKTSTPRRWQAKVKNLRRLFFDGKPTVGCTRSPLPLPEELMRKLGGGFGFTKIDLADAYNQVRLGPESRKRLALSTHRGVLLKMFFHLEFHQLQVTSGRSWMTSLLIFLVLRFI